MPIEFDVVTLFPAMFDAVSRHGISGRALERGLYNLHFWNPRDYAVDAHRSVDDRPYGGGPGMVMMAEPLALAIAAARARQAQAGVAGRVICLSPQGSPLTHQRVVELTRVGALTLVCGRYEGIDQRLIDSEVDEELSLGNFVLSGGEIAAMAVIDALARQLPGALNDENSAVQESFVAGLLDCPHYTRPEVWRGRGVPPVLMSGHHDNIARWRRTQALAATWRKRPEMLACRQASKEDESLLAAWRRGEAVQ